MSKILELIEGGKSDLYGASLDTPVNFASGSGIAYCTSMYIREDTVISAVTTVSGALTANFIGETMIAGDIIVFDEPVKTITFASGSAICYTANPKK
jgi:hypothetical protein